jgi:hypothetical protein|tara:strand:- start:1107 stop:1310 length:204 start_codon:yes stop_codon:yes gene_type:complete
MSKTNEYYRILQEDEDFKEYEKEVGSLVESHLPKPRSKEAKENLKEYKKLTSMLLYSKKNYGAKGNA